jgi:hypothetical protein
MGGGYYKQHLDFIPGKMSKEEYRALYMRILSLLTNIVSPENCRHTLSSDFKSEHSDSDLVILAPCCEINNIINALQPDETKRGKSDIYHILLDGRQVDITFVSSVELLNYNIFFKSYSSVSIILGKMIKRQNLKLTGNGLELGRITESKKKPIRDFFLTNDVETILSWLSAPENPLTYAEFVDLQQREEHCVADFLARSRFFSSSIFKNLNEGILNKEKIKENTRMEHMINYSKLHETVCHIQVTEVDIVTFFNKSEEYQEITSIEKKVFIEVDKFKKKFNGNIVQTIIPELDTNEKLGKYMKKFPKDPNEFNYTLDFVNAIFSLSEGDELNNFIKSYGN